ncbi:MAG: HD-GYP domain-containing protein [Bacillota bacterium]
MVIFLNPAKRDPSEYELVKRHTNHGFEILKAKSSLNHTSAHVAYQHHEREDGSGYPRGLAGKEIHRFASKCGRHPYRP